MMISNKNPLDIKLDDYEQEIEDNLEKAKRLPSEEEQKEIILARQAASNHVLKRHHAWQSALDKNEFFDKIFK